MKAPNRVLRQLVSVIGSVSCVSLKEGNTILRQLVTRSSQPLFPLLRELSVSLSFSERNAGDLRRSIIHLLRLAHYFPLLSILSIDLDVDPEAVIVLHEDHVEHIGRREQLCSLTLAGFSVTGPALIRLCSMRQLTTLHLGGCTVIDQARNAPASCDVTEVQLAWSKLVLPRHSGLQISLPSAHPPSLVRDANEALASIDYLLQSTDADQGCDKLAFLWYCRWPSATLLSKLTNLTSLGLNLSSTAALNDAAADLPSFIHPTQHTPCLPHLRHFAVTWQGMIVEVPQSVYSRILSVYSPQLQSLDVRLPRLMSWSGLLDVVLSCRELRRLVLHGCASPAEPDARSATRQVPQPVHQHQLGLRAQLRPSLAHLHSLQLDWLSLSDSQLVELLHCSPQLEDVGIRERTGLTRAILRELGTCCPRLRRLRLQTDNVLFLESSATAAASSLTASRLTSSAIAAPTFQSLSILSLVCSAYLDFYLAPPALLWLKALLRSTPCLRYLRLGVHEPPLHELRWFGRFTRLTALRVWASPQPPPAIRRFFTANPLGQPHQQQRRQREERQRRNVAMHLSGQLLHAATISTLELGGDVQSYEQMVRDVEHLADFSFVFAREREGKSGRKNFFAALPESAAGPVRPAEADLDEPGTSGGCLCCAGL